MFFLFLTLDRNSFNFFFSNFLIIYLCLFLLLKRCVCESNINFLNPLEVKANKEYNFNNVPSTFGKITTTTTTQVTQGKFSVADFLKKRNTVNAQVVENKSNAYESAPSFSTLAYWDKNRKARPYLRLFFRKRSHEKNTKCKTVQNLVESSSQKQYNDTTNLSLGAEENFDRGVYNLQDIQFRSSNISSNLVNNVLYIQLKSSNISKLNKENEKLVVEPASLSFFQSTTTQSPFNPSYNLSFTYEDEKLTNNPLSVKNSFTSIVHSKEYVFAKPARNQLRQLQEDKNNVQTEFSFSQSSLITDNTTYHTIEGLGIIPFELLGTTRVQEASQPNFPQVASYTPYDFYSNDEPVTTHVVGTGATPFPGEDTFVYCYPFNEKQIVEKCSMAKDFHAVGVYVPMMMEVQMKHEMSWYSELRRLKRLTNLKVVGIAYEMPNWDLIVNILLNNPQLFDGVLIEWVGRFACIAKMPVPTVKQLHSIKTATRSGILRYFVHEQNYDMCNTSHIEFLGNTTFTNLKTMEDQTFMSILRPTQGFIFPPYIQPVFACMGGQEGFCYKAFKSNPVASCSLNQRYIFNPYEYVGGRMLHLLNETCHGLPSYDLYGVV